MARVNPEFISEITKYGAVDFRACFNCGNCTATCSLSTTDNSFPREMIRYSMLGLEDEIAASLKPWQCYYCGECSTSCPRQADPANLMMSLRRFLISKYDWTGLSRKFYTSALWEIGSILFISLIVLMGFILFHGEMTTILTSDGGVKLNTFAPWQYIEIADWSVAALLAFFLLTNIANMYMKVIGSQKDLKIPVKLYFTELYSLIFHFLFQWNFSKCDAEKVSFWTKIKTGKYTYWLIHFLLMSSYVMLFVMIVVFLNWFQTDHIYNWYYPQRLLGYYSTIGLMVGITYFAVLRFKKSGEKSKKTHLSDWVFLFLLMTTAITGILLHFFRINGMPMATYYTYVIHLMVLFPMIIIEVPFSKWSHLAYRPVAIYFSRIINAVKK